MKKIVFILIFISGLVQASSVDIDMMYNSAQNQLECRITYSGYSEGEGILYTTTADLFQEDNETNSDAVNRINIPIPENEFLYNVTLVCEKNYTCITSIIQDINGNTTFSNSYSKISFYTCNQSEYSGSLSPDKGKKIQNIKGNLSAKELEAKGRANDVIPLIFDLMIFVVLLFFMFVLKNASFK